MSIANQATYRLATALAVLVLTSLAVADDVPLVRITFQEESPSGRVADERKVEGKIVAEKGGTLLLVDRTGRLWPVTPDRLLSREETSEIFEPFTQEEMAAELQKELGDGFRIVTTRNYILCTEASREYARWNGMLFERLMAAFKKLWDRKPLELTGPEFPLCAIILKDKGRYQDFARKDAGAEVLDALGYYSTLTNRMVMYDLTEGLAGVPPRNYAELNKRLLGQISNVSTIVHEATHQLAFNTGLHTRLADNPFWLVEGMAMFFETPDLNNVAGWRTIGALNTSRLKTYQDYYRNRRTTESFREMIVADSSFNNADTALDVYSEAWALSYYLIKVRRDDYMKYLEAISRKQDVFKKDEPEERLAEFESYFGEIEDVERGMLRYLSARVR